MTYEPLVGLFLEYLFLIEELSKLTQTRKSRRISVTHLREKSEELEIKFRKWSNLDESVISNSKFSKIEHDRKSSLKGWDMIGMWHENSRIRFQGI